MKIRDAVLLFAVILPQPLKQALYRALGWRFGKRVKIGLSYIQADSVNLGDDVTIGNFNTIRNLREFSLGNRVFLLNFNDIFGAHLYQSSAARFVVGENTLIMSRHFFDVAGNVQIGADTTIGGRDTQFWSHTRTYDADGKPALVALDVTIGNNVYIGARATLIGCRVPDGAIVAACSVVVKQHEDEPQRIMLAGNPATVKKRYDIPGTSKTPAI